MRIFNIESKENWLHGYLFWILSSETFISFFLHLKKSQRSICADQPAFHQHKTDIENLFGKKNFLIFFLRIFSPEKKIFSSEKKIFSSEKKVFSSEKIISPLERKISLGKTFILTKPSLETKFLGEKYLKMKMSV